ncbi:MAG TPA: glycosyltransferase [Campylobacterales bacterium]|nr:glycosyltransferase [Campylobacterales bacterium]
MKICLIIDSLAGAGAERVVVSLAEGFLRLNHEVHIVLLEDVVEYDVDERIFIHILKEKDVKTLQKLILELEDSNDKKFDFIYSHLHGKIKIIKQAKLQNIYYMFHIPISKRFENKGFINRFLTKKKFQLRYKNENLITVSKGIEEDLYAHNFKAKSITTIYNPFNFDAIKSVADVADKDIPDTEYIINVARFHFQKRHDVLLKAFAKSGLGCKLLLLGKGSLEEKSKIKSLIKKLGIEEKVIMIGFKKNPYPLMKNAKLFVLSSDFEGFGNVLVESLILDTPVVSTNCKSGPSEIMVGNLSRYLTPVVDVDSLARMMKKAFYDEIVIEQGDLERFRDEKIVAEYLEIRNSDG